MLHPLLLLALGGLMAAAQVDESCKDEPPRPPVPATGLPVGKWRIEFANGVIEECRIGEDGAAAVVEPLRSAGGTATLRDGSAVIAFHDDRLERWTPIGKWLVVEHWFPASQLPLATPVLGIAERID